MVQNIVQEYNFSFPDGYLSLEETQQRNYPVRKALGKIYKIALLCNRLKGNFIMPDVTYVKHDNQTIKPQNPSKRVGRNSGNDRVFPLETVQLQQFRTKHDSDIGEATIHVGPYADELARSYNALALTIGLDIFFRDKAYKPGSEETQKIMAHELTHVAQHKEGFLTKNISMEGLEAEATLAENKEIYEEDPIVYIEVNGNKYRFRKSKMRYHASRVAKSLTSWIEEQKYLLDEEEYLKFACSMIKWIKG